ncbi:MAG: MerR family transcriptional regulator [Paenibacillus macerans]|uniref:MerR family transcriptional regulator n=1 Tax=Paenibacillus macerans TaxID=44252 RepID=A0A090YHP6_PAEMA|nr:MerR family transcriptional regulator [Paenibacillus macerans]KFM98338.1 merR regulatory family protein [Paenibacillus macerans]MBS5911203.1 MerR family transcriptional regulator [Paenibacillus macerans]MCY7562582.1 MerR family transcriptional regulator [Paenibacillus macerans]MDU5948627.1 MerR family transcriptional regulator [Paenibacillus macerans]MDU7472590.1 MerR family transcriptional regulator [Paenibacillus macerans]
MYRIGELAKAANVSERTIDYYTKLGLISPEKRTQKNYRLYSAETLTRLERINQMKQEKYTLEEIREKLEQWDRVTHEEQVSEKLSSLELHLQQLQREVKELEPLISNLQPNQVKRAFAHLMPQSLACMEALRFLVNHGPFS